MMNQKLRSIVVETGTFRVVVLLTSVYIACSITMTWVLQKMMGRSFGWEGVFMAVVVPLLIVPPVVFVNMKLVIGLHDLDTRTRKLAAVDSLTELYNRRAFLEMAVSLMNLGRRNDLVMTVAYIDIDCFKGINDSWGHRAGDRVLESFGHLLTAQTRVSDIVGRIGGEEFAIFLTNTDTAGAVGVAEKIRVAAENHAVATEAGSIQYTVSIGLATSGMEDNESLDDLLARADAALYGAKQSGRNRVMTEQDAEYARFFRETTA
jgi:diguanylate cyclase (GGDEF)-like protein